MREYIVQILLDGNFSRQWKVMASDKTDAVRKALIEEATNWVCDTPDYTTTIEVIKVIEKK